MRFSTKKLRSDPRLGQAHRQRSGQAMLIAILSIGGALLGATTVAGLLMLYQIRATTDSENSAKAIFAADSGVECALYNDLRPQPVLCRTVFTNGAVDSVECQDMTGTPILCTETSTAASAISTGVSGGSDRAFFVEFTGATTTYP